MHKKANYRRKQTFSVTNKLHIFDMSAPWKYVPIPPNKIPPIRPRGWGSIPIEVKVGNTVWKTSMFPIKKEGYFIPIKRAVVKKEQLRVGEKVTVKYSAI